ncbi:hypothetical protein RDV89_08990 [Nocardioides zeae]|uniref:Uncharacterized protein n=1 Tax=Nocardioides imazamoxiresistens TaxID=3231893 RepID=A0ABU3PWI9_9ACTN|nr:hypothetical protein [Nocardioides zeae]MDT9593202.1 hypothetical protein [Nocardioides zeae]
MSGHQPPPPPPAGPPGPPGPPGFQGPPTAPLPQPPRRGGWKVVLPAVLGVLALVAAIAVIVWVLSTREDDTDDAGGSGGSGDDRSSAESEGTGSGDDDTDGGGDAGAFCDAVLVVEEVVDDQPDEDMDLGEAIEALEGAPPPDSAGEDVTAGYEAYLDVLREADGGSRDDADDLIGELERDGDFVAFATYAQQECFEDPDDDATDDATDDGSDDPDDSDDSGDRDGSGRGDGPGGNGIGGEIDPDRED